jgi:sulfate transport system substrate-binding protein
MQLVRRLLVLLVIGYLLAAAAWVLNAGVIRDEGRDELLNVACDPTRELWHELNGVFVERYEQEKGTRLSVRQSHGGSASQARAVIDGLDADVVSLALWSDTDAVRKAGLIDPGWEDRLPNRSLPYTSTIVFVVRKANPKAVRDWPDLARPDVSVITPNPKTSGNGKWSFLAAWGSVVTRGGSEADAREYVTALYRRVQKLDTAARGATITFSQNKIGDVHLTWENEAYLEVQEANGDLEIVYPPVSVLAEPHVALVSTNARRKGTTQAAEAYLRFLYTDDAQEIIAKHYHRPTNPAVWQRHAARFPPLKLFRVSEIASNWDDVQKRFFAEGAVFDQVFGARR